MGPLESIIPAIAKPVCETLIDRLFTRQSGGFSDQSCKGNWHAHWTITQPKDFKPKEIDDLITIKINKRGKVSGKGVNPFYGKYIISGTDMPFAMTLTYQPAGGSASYPGICLILKDADTSVLQGVWLQQHGKHGLLSGILSMTRPKE